MYVRREKLDALPRAGLPITKNRSRGVHTLQVECMCLFSLSREVDEWLPARMGISVRVDAPRRRRHFRKLPESSWKLGCTYTGVQEGALELLRTAHTQPTELRHTWDMSTVYVHVKKIKTVGVQPEAVKAKKWSVQTPQKEP